MKNVNLLGGAIALAAILIGGSSANANPPFQVSFTQGTGGTWNADWNSTFGSRTFFAQGSTDLVNWEYLPVLEFGTGLKGAGISTSGAPKYFFRLVYVDEAWVTTEQEARDADFDGDGIPNWFEVEDIGSDPLDRSSAGGDSDADGLPDGWEKYFFAGLGVANPNIASQPDGLTNKEKAELGLDPSVDYSNPAATQSAKFNYDLAGRLTGVTAPVGSASFTPDAEGNILNAQ